MSKSENADHLPGQLASPRRNGRTLKLGGGPPNYLQNGLKAVAEPFKGNTVDGTVVPNGNDYGKDLLRQHYETAHRTK